MRDEYRAGKLPQPNLANLDNYFEIGLSQDHEMRRWAPSPITTASTPPSLARRHYHHPMPADGRLWTGTEEAEVKPVARASGKRPKRFLSGCGSRARLIPWNSTVA